MCVVIQSASFMLCFLCAVMRPVQGSSCGWSCIAVVQRRTTQQAAHRGSWPASWAHLWEGQQERKWGRPWSPEPAAPLAMEEERQSCCLCPLYRKRVETHTYKHTAATWIKNAKRIAVNCRPVINVCSMIWKYNKQHTILFKSLGSVRLFLNVFLMRTRTAFIGSKIQ